jgi:hypothetical protein
VGCGRVMLAVCLHCSCMCLLRCCLSRPLEPADVAVALHCVWVCLWRKQRMSALCRKIVAVPVAQCSADHVVCIHRIVPGADALQFEGPEVQCAKQHDAQSGYKYGRAWPANPIMTR